VGDAQIDDDDRRRLTVALQPDLASGEYTVTWHTLSAEDGDEDEDTFTFTVDPEAQETSTPMSAGTNSPATLAATSSPAVVPAAPTSFVAAPTQPPTPAPAARGGGGLCGGALLPVAGMVFVACGTRRRRK
jgi:hypothetical protein